MESNWGLETLGRSSCFIKGMKGVAFSRLVFFRGFVATLVWSTWVSVIGSPNDTWWKSWAFVVQIVVTCTSLLLLLLYNTASNRNGSPIVIRTPIVNAIAKTTSFDYKGCLWRKWKKKNWARFSHAFPYNQRNNTILPTASSDNYRGSKSTSNTMLYRYCKAIHGELALEIAKEFEREYVSLPFDDAKVPHIVSVVQVWMRLVYYIVLSSSMNQYVADRNFVYRIQGIGTPSIECETFNFL